jgi:hypothetical protein
MAGNARSLSLDSLRAANLKTVGCGVRVERHILRLEWCGTIAVLFEDTTKSCSNNAFTYIAARSC